MYLYENPALPVPSEPAVIPTHIAWLPDVLPWASCPHIHTKEYEISLIFGGSGRLCLPGTLLPVEAGTLTIVPPETAHYFLRDEESSAPLSYATIRFRASASPGGLQEQLKALGITTAQISRESLSVFTHLKESIYAEAARLRSNRTQPVSLLLAQAAFHLAREDFAVCGHPVSVHLPLYANDILLYLQQHTHSTVRVEDLAAEFHLSQSHLFRIFLQTYHLSPIRYLIFCRMGEARTLLLKGGMTVPEIARLLAYKSTYHFVKTFEQFYHCSPYEYKE